MTTWVDVTGIGATFFTAFCDDIAYSPTLGRYVVVKCVSSAPATNIVATSDDFITFTNRGLAGFSGFIVQGNSSPFRIVWADTLGLFVLVGGTQLSSPATRQSISTSADGITWTTQGNPWWVTSLTKDFGVDWSNHQGLLAAVCGLATSATVGSVATSPDGITWTLRTSNISLNSICYSVDLDLWVAVGTDSAGFIQSSPDAITWTTRYSNGSGSVPLAGFDSVIWSTTLKVFFAAGGIGLFSSPDGITWSEVNTTFNENGGSSTFIDSFRAVWALTDCTDQGIVLVVGGNSPLGNPATTGFSTQQPTVTCAGTTDGVAWFKDNYPFQYVGASGARQYGIRYFTSLGKAVVCGPSFSFSSTGSGFYSMTAGVPTIQKQKFKEWIE